MKDQFVVVSRQIYNSECCLLRYRNVSSAHFGYRQTWGIFSVMSLFGFQGHVSCWNSPGSQGIMDIKFNGETHCRLVYGWLYIWWIVWHFSTHLNVCMCVWVCVFFCMYAYVHSCLCTYMSVCMYTSVGVCIVMCMCLCAECVSAMEACWDSKSMTTSFPQPKPNDSPYAGWLRTTAHCQEPWMSWWV